MKSSTGYFSINDRTEIFPFVLVMICISVISPLDLAFAQPANNDVSIESTILYSAIDTSGMTAEFNSSGEPQPVLSGINLREHDEVYNSETIETVLDPRQQIEYMANIDQGEVLLYTWEVDGKVYYDFHAHQENVDPDIWIRYSEGANLRSSGSIIAPYAGEHGWYWVNLDTRPVKLKLTVSGYYKNIFRVDL
jgi:hypothetical protein